MKEHIFNGKELVNTFEGDSALRAFIEDLFAYAKKNGTVTKMEVDSLRDLGTVTFTLKEQSFGKYSHQFIDVPFNMGYLNAWKLIEKEN